MKGIVILSDISKHQEFNNGKISNELLECLKAFSGYANDMLVT